MDKTKVVFHRPNPRVFIRPLPIYKVAQVSQVKLLCVFINETLKADSHVKFILGQCSQRTYLLKLLRNQRLSPNCLRVILHTVITSRFLYVVSLGWFSFG